MSEFAPTPGRRGSAIISAWIVQETRVFASANVATTRGDRRRGMKAFPDASTPLVIQPCRWVHSIGMRFPIDVVYLDANDTIVAIKHLKPGRVSLPVLRAVRVVETAPGTFRHWGLGPGDNIRIRDADIPTERNWTPPS